MRVIGLKSIAIQGIYIVINRSCASGVGSNNGWVLVSDAVKRPMHKDVPLPVGLKSEGTELEEKKPEDAPVDTQVENPKEGQDS